MAEGSLAQACPAISEYLCLGHHEEASVELLSKLSERADAVQLAGELGRLDVVTAVLAVLAIMLGFGSIAGFWMLRGAAKNAAKAITPEAVEVHLQRNGVDLLKEAMSDPQMLAKLHAAWVELGLNDADKAEFVDIRSK